MKIIGIDPGLAATGIGIVNGSGYRIDDFSFGSIQTKKEIVLANRLDCIFSKLLDLLDSETPDLMVIEDVFSLDVRKPLLKYPTLFASEIFPLL